MLREVAFTVFLVTVEAVGKCGFGCQGDCSACTGWSSSDWCVKSRDSCEGSCGGTWCSGGPSPPAPGPSPPAPGPSPPAPESDRCDSPNAPLGSKCTGCPPKFDGKLCASTTRYFDQTKGACGCGQSDPPPPDFWNFQHYTAALNCKNLDPANPHLAWCPSQCGGCYRLCSTGGKVQGKAADPGVCRVFKISNRCGDGFDGDKPYPYLCSNQITWKECAENPAKCKVSGNTNFYGYPAHFDLMDFAGQITGAGGLNWDNPEVTFEQVSCTEWKGPDWDCQCKSPFLNLTKPGLVV